MEWSYNTKACRGFIKQIAGSMRNNLKASFDIYCYCSLLFDGSTDKGTTEKVVISIKLIEKGVTLYNKVRKNMGSY